MIINVETSQAAVVLTATSADGGRESKLEVEASLPLPQRLCGGSQPSTSHGPQGAVRAASKAHYRSK